MTRSKRFVPNRRHLAQALVVPVAICLLWQSLYSAGIIHGFGVTAPSLILFELWRLTSNQSQYGSAWPNIVSSLTLVVAGTTFGALLGVPLGIVIAWNQLAKRLLISLLYVIRPVPPIALLPIVVVLFGIGDGARLILIVAATGPTIAFTVVQAVEAIDPILLRVAGSLGATPLQMLRTIIIPAAVPGIFTAIRVAATLGFMTVVAAELLGATQGLGYLLSLGARNFDTSFICAVMLIIALLSLLLDAMLKRARDAAWYWRESQ